MTTVEDIRLAGLDPSRLCSGVRHELVDYDPSRRIRERVEEIGLKAFRVSPDICHMLVAEDGWSISASGRKCVCDPTLPPNSIVGMEEINAK
jgi:hypothetical protein